MGCARSPSGPPRRPTTGSGSSARTATNTDGGSPHPAASVARLQLISVHRLTRRTGAGSQTGSLRGRMVADRAEHRRNESPGRRPWANVSEHARSRPVSPTIKVQVTALSVSRHQERSRSGSQTGSLIAAGWRARPSPQQHRVRRRRPGAVVAFEHPQVRVSEDVGHLERLDPGGNQGEAAECRSSYGVSRGALSGRTRRETSGERSTGEGEYRPQSGTPVLPMTPRRPTRPMRSSAACWARWRWSASTTAAGIASVRVPFVFVGPILEVGRHRRAGGPGRRGWCAPRSRWRSIQGRRPRPVGARIGGAR